MEFSIFALLLSSSALVLSDDNVAMESNLDYQESYMVSSHAEEAGGIEIRKGFADALSEQSPTSGTVSNTGKRYRIRQRYRRTQENVQKEEPNNYRYANQSEESNHRGGFYRQSQTSSNNVRQNSAVPLEVGENHHHSSVQEYLNPYRQVVTQRIPTYAPRSQRHKGKDRGSTRHMGHYLQKEDSDPEIQSALSEGSMSDIRKINPKYEIPYKKYQNGNDSDENSYLVANSETRTALQVRLPSADRGRQQDASQSTSYRVRKPELKSAVIDSHSVNSQINHQQVSHDSPSQPKVTNFFSYYQDQFSEENDQNLEGTTHGFLDEGFPKTELSSSNFHTQFPMNVRENSSSKPSIDSGTNEPSNHQKTYKEISKTSNLKRQRTRIRTSISSQDKTQKISNESRGKFKPSRLTSRYETRTARPVSVKQESEIEESKPVQTDHRTETEKVAEIQKPTYQKVPDISHHRESQSLDSPNIYEYDVAEIAPTGSSSLSNTKSLHSQNAKRVTSYSSNTNTRNSYSTSSNTDTSYSVSADSGSSHSPSTQMGGSSSFSNSNTESLYSTISNKGNSRPPNANRGGSHSSNSDTESSRSTNIDRGSSYTTSRNRGSSHSPSRNRESSYSNTVTQSSFSSSPNGGNPYFTSTNTYTSPYSPNTDEGNSHPDPGNSYSSSTNTGTSYFANTNTGSPYSSNGNAGNSYSTSTSTTGGNSYSISVRHNFPKKTASKTEYDQVKWNSLASTKQETSKPDTNYDAVVSEVHNDRNTWNSFDLQNYQVSKPEEDFHHSLYAEENNKNAYDVPVVDKENYNVPIQSKHNKVNHNSLTYDGREIFKTNNNSNKELSTAFGHYLNKWDSPATTLSPKMLHYDVYEKQLDHSTENPSLAYHYQRNGYSDNGKTANVFDHQKALKGSTAFNMKNVVGTETENVRNSYYPDGSLYRSHGGSSGAQHIFAEDLGEGTYGYLISKAPASSPYSSEEDGRLDSSEDDRDGSSSRLSISAGSTRLLPVEERPGGVSTLNSDYLKQIKIDDLSPSVVKILFPKRENILEISKFNTEGSRSQKLYPVYSHSGVPFFKYAKEVHFQPKHFLNADSIRGHLSGSDWKIYKTDFPIVDVEYKNKKIIPILMKKRKNSSNQSDDGLILGKSRPGREKRKPKDLAVFGNRFRGRRNEFSVSTSYKVNRDFQNVLAPKNQISYRKILAPEERDACNFQGTKPFL